MKHIKKSFLIQQPSNFLDLSKSEFKKIDFSKEFAHDKKIKANNNIVFIETDQNLLIGGFIHKENGLNYVLPVPDPTLIYFNNAQEITHQIKKFRKNLFDKLNMEEGALTETALNEIYQYYGASSGFVIFLFTSIESFINQMIPENFIYKNNHSKRTELYNKTQIQESIDFKTKITKVMSQITGNDFFKKRSPTNEYIWNLKTFRDEIIHTKPQDDNPLRYKDLIKKSLNFKYDKALESVAKFMNYYKPNYITECGCGVDY